MRREALDLRHPIGVFDSGVGGLTVLKALRQKLPFRDFVYVADTARVPYGRKPREMVERFAHGITRFLLDLGVEGVVIACNTASAAALPRLAGNVSVPVWGVIEPGVDAAVAKTRSKYVGVIGTKGAIASGAYQSRLEARGMSVWAQACPMLVHVVEDGLADSNEAVLLAHHYLDSRPPIDTLILGCTHYPILRDVLQRAVGDAVYLVESSEVTAEAVRRSLVDTNGRRGGVVHFVTGDVLAYQHTAGLIGGVDGEVIPLAVSRLRELE